MAEIKTATSNTERVQRGATLYEEAFRDDPVIRYMLGLSEKSKGDYLRKYFRCLLTAASLNGATFTETDDWSSCCVLMSPGQRVDNIWTLLPAGMPGIVWKLGLGGFRRMMMEYAPLTDAAKAKGLAGQKRYYYVFFLGTADKARGRGYGSSLIRQAQDFARKDGLPMWLEATTKESYELYMRLGFETVEQLVLGKGTAAADGTLQEGGEGVPVWAMVWWPGKFTGHSGAE